MSKSTDKIHKAFEGVELFVLADGDYAAPTSHWLLDTWKVQWLELLEELPYSKRHDCDDFAFEYKIAVQHQHAESEFPDDGFAVGVCFYLVGGDRERGHAINWALTEDVALIFIEPQSGEQIQLTDAEKATIFFVYG